MEKLQQLDESKDGMFDNVIDRMKGGVFENLDDSKNGLVSGQDDRDKEEEGDEDEEDDKDEDEADEEGDGDAVTSPAVRFGPQMNKNKAITLKLPYSYFHCLTHSAMLLHGSIWFNFASHYHFNVQYWHHFVFVLGRIICFNHNAWILEFAFLPNTLLVCACLSWSVLV